MPYDFRTCVSTLKGLASHVPLLQRATCRSTGGTSDARYCYTVWLRHLDQIRSATAWPPPHSVAELGPGDSLGIGLCALLSGAPSYLALDACHYGSAASHGAIFSELATAFRSDIAAPGQKEFPLTWPPLRAELKPSLLLNREVLESATAGKRIADIGAALADAAPPPPLIRHVAPWTGQHLLNHPSDLSVVFSQAVLEHVDDLEETYRALGQKLKPGAVMSHVIDFKSHGITSAWHGHWSIGSRRWRIIRGNRPYLINRMPWSFHRRLMETNGFEILKTLPRHDAPALRDHLAPDIAHLIDDDDLRTAGVYVLARKQ